MKQEVERYQIHLERETGVIQFFGDFCLQQGLLSSSDFFSQDQIKALKVIKIDLKAVSNWDSSFLIPLQSIMRVALNHQIKIDYEHFPEGLKRLLLLSEEASPLAKATGTEKKLSFFTQVGENALAVYDSFLLLSTFLGELIQSFGRLFKGQARFLVSDLVIFLKDASANALPIVSLISFLVGLTFAFVAAIQLQQFGAQIYIANLVGLAMAREMGAMMTGIIMAGRTGASYAAQLGTMQVNEEIDALTTFGLSPIDFLVLPRVIALIIMMPLLTIYSNFLGILGGAFVSVVMMKLTLVQYFNQLQEGVALQDFYAGLIKACVFGVLVALAGCMRGLQCGRDSASVGQATTSAVVTGILYIIVFDAILTVIYNAIGF